MKLKILNEGYDLRFVVKEYPNGGTAVDLITVDSDKPAALFTRLSVCIAATPQLKPGEFFVRVWSENQELLTKLTEGGYIEIVEPSADQAPPSYGNCLCRLTEKGRQWIVPQPH